MVEYKDGVFEKLKDKSPEYIQEYLEANGFDQVIIDKYKKLCL